MKHLFVLFFLLLVSSNILSQSNYDHLDKSDEFYRKFDLKNAAINYDQAYKHNPEDYNTLLKITRIYNDLGEDYYENADEKNA